MQKIQNNIKKDEVFRKTNTPSFKYYKTMVPKINRVKLIGLEINLFLWPNDVKYEHKDHLL